MLGTNQFNPLVSILINNYNYGHFLGEAIYSALNQTYTNIEVIVVDDGSTDHSRDIIAGFGGKITTVLKENGGHASAINAGYAASRGEIICLLDSDDIFYPHKVEVIVNFFKNNKSTNPYQMVYHLLEIVNGDGVATGEKKPRAVFPTPPNLYDWACKYRFIPFDCAPTSGIAINRELAQIAFPIPQVRNGGETFLVYLAELLGEVRGIDQVLTKYKVHGKNDHIGRMVSQNYRFWPKSFYLSWDEYLNKKLMEHGKKPVISFFDSLYASYYFYYQKQFKDIFRLSFNMLKWHIDARTLKWSLKSLFWGFVIIGQILKVVNNHHDANKNITKG